MLAGDLMDEVIGLGVAKYIAVIAGLWRFSILFTTIGSATSDAWIGVGILGLACRTMKGQRGGISARTVPSFLRHFDFRADGSRISRAQNKHILFPGRQVGKQADCADHHENNEIPWTGDPLPGNVHLPLLAKAHEMAASSCPRVDPMDLVSYPIGSNVKAPYDDTLRLRPGLHRHFGDYQLSRHWAVVLSRRYFVKNLMRGPAF
ncbi:hypothetical protein BO79DRAFT_231955 [Aspergillus costaricaensis CBS 115574]|uniref:Uncharacterized protein n=1 Tax=Aspergillus costaricaensis CBS 115574 TaxID=1448317 RepID=A0ACD1I416_9EURO|nr:hypothetical protein BO79DRAFT_231955 [Aspergillus costaricaensis CBS 115574]RAK85034.1 hypothetical protein BO79DRAFT_231955 [Aspergillus costaricaensis CBS 115574]